MNVDRTPLVTPLHFARLGDSIVWISEPTARHSENAFRNGKAELWFGMIKSEQFS